mgnify:FL=1
MNKRKNVYIQLLILVLLILIFIYISSNRDKDILSIGNIKIGEEEYSFWLNRNKNKIISKYFSSDEEIDFNKSLDGKRALDLLYKDTFDEIKKYHQIWEESKSLGLIKGNNFYDFLNRFKKENEERGDKLNNKENIFGLNNFKIDQFLEYESDSLSSSIKKDYLKDKEISDDEINDFYEENKEYLFKNYPNVNVSYLEVDGSEINKDIDILENDLFNIKKKLESGEDFTTILNSYGYLKKYFHIKEFKSQDIEANYRANEGLFSIIFQMKENVSEIIQYENIFILVKIDKYEDMGYRDIKEVKSTIKEILLDEYFTEYWNEKVEKNEVNILIKDFDKYTINLLEEELNA